MFDVTIIGAGPAGISASLYTKRANLNVLVLYHGGGNLEKAHKIDNYYGFPQGISGPDLYQNGIDQAKNLGVEVREAEVTHLAFNDDMTFTVTAAGQEIQTKTLIIATGNKKLRPAIKGIEEFEGKGVSYCAICDAFAYRKKDVVVIGDGKFAASEANDIVNIASSVKILTNGKDKAYLESITEGKYQIDDRKIVEIKGNAENTKVGAVIFSDGSQLATDGVFIALGEAGASDFAKKLGLALNGDSIIVNENMETNISGIYSCGNATGGLLQICKAVYEGGKAGLSAVEFVRHKTI
ncbi:MAG: NAD(P)/FAD-dependent oxidoreductase [Treponemataceae bacterium]|nr:NAD(P)/FAD-dependent oxidoreductase [Treponemataceae bacterium]